MKSRRSRYMENASRDNALADHLIHPKLERKDVRASCACAACNKRDIVGLTVKPVGKLDAGNPHVQFDTPHAQV